MITQTFTPVSEQKWADIKTAFAQGGVTIAEDSGELDHEGVKASWVYADDTLVIDVLSVSKLDEWAGYNEQAVMDRFKAWIAGVQ
jgi:hypothetical protein